MRTTLGGAVTKPFVTAIRSVAVVGTRRRYAVAIALALSGMAATAGHAAEDGTTGLTLAVPGRSNAHVSVAADARLVVATWSASLPSGQTDIYAAVSRDGGRTFSSPVQVNQTPGDARVNGEQPPRVVLAPRPGASPAVVVVWTSKNAKGGMLLTARSVDVGRTFGPTSVVPGGEAEGNRGWQAIAADSNGRVSALWLDHRQLARADAGMASTHQHPTTGGASPPAAGSAPAAKPDGVAMAQLSQLYVSSLDGGFAPRPLTGGVCYCCKTALVAGPGGALYAAWRHVYPGNLRDMAFAMSSDGGRTFTSPLRVSEDKWQIEGCPDDGPTLARAADGRLHIVWPTLVSEGPGGSPSIGLFHATSSDGKRFSPRVRVPTEGVPHHPQATIALNGAVTVVWDELIGGKRRVVLAHGVAAKDGHVAFARQVLSDGNPAVYPMAVATSDGVVTAWTSNISETSVIRVDQRRRQ